MPYERIIDLDIVDEEGYQKCRDAMLPILKACGGAFGFDLKVLEVLLSKTEDNINRVFTIIFPGREKMDEFFSDRDYVTVKNRYLKNDIKSKLVISMHETDV